MEEKDNPLMATNSKRMATNTILFVAIRVLLFVAISGLPSVARAATLYFSPASGSYTVGTSFTINIYTSSPDQFMNAASGAISFPKDKLEALAISKSGSIISLWVQEPSFSNGAGTINFEGIVLNPGFSSNAGKVLSVTFKVKAAGLANLNFSSGSVLANDGKGTNILAGLGTAEFGLNPQTIGPTAPQSTTPAETPGVPLAPRISSPTHPDPNQWYNNSKPTFTWDAPSGVTAVRLLYDENPSSRPTVVYSPAISEKALEQIEDGVYYFHAQFKNAFGWGAVAHFRFQIDTQPPIPFSIKFAEGRETDNPRPTVVFDTTDSLSGISHYRIKIGEGDGFELSLVTVKHNPYSLPPQAPGKRNILVQAFDLAGNFSLAVEEFIIKPLEAPVFTDYSPELRSGDVLVVKGRTIYPDSQIILWLQKEKDEPKSYSAAADSDGDFLFVFDEKLKDGIYKIWAEVSDSRGAKSRPSDALVIVVQPPAFLKIGSWTISFLSVIIPLVALIIGLLAIIWYGWYRLSRLRKRLKKEVREAEEASRRAFDLLKKDARKQIKILEAAKDRRRLTEEEEEIISQFKNDLAEAEKFVKKEIKDIEQIK